MLLLCQNLLPREELPFTGQALKSRGPTLAGPNGAELPLDRTVRAGDVAPGSLRGVWVPAVAVITHSWRRRKDEEQGVGEEGGQRRRRGEKGGGGRRSGRRREMHVFYSWPVEKQAASSRLENHHVHQSLTRSDNTPAKAGSASKTPSSPCLDQMKVCVHQAAGKLLQRGLIASPSEPNRVQSPDLGHSGGSGRVYLSVSPAGG